jgi:hypothetical protein
MSMAISRLEAHLNEHGLRVEVLNAGVGGYGTSVDVALLASDTRSRLRRVRAGRAPTADVGHSISDPTISRATRSCRCRFDNLAISARCARDPLGSCAYCARPDRPAGYPCPGVVRALARTAINTGLFSRISLPPHTDIASGRCSPARLSFSAPPCGAGAC